MHVAAIRAEHADTLVAGIKAMSYDEMTEHLCAELGRAIAST